MMTDASDRPALEIDPETALALRDWLITLSQRLGLDATVAADTPSPPTTTAPETIATYLGDLAAILDTVRYLRSDTATVRIRIDREPVPDADYVLDVESHRPVFDDRATRADTDFPVGECSTHEPAPCRGGDSEMASTTMPHRGDYVDADRHPRDPDRAINAALPDEIWCATPTRSPPHGSPTSSASDSAGPPSAPDEDDPESGLD